MPTIDSCLDPDIVGLRLMAKTNAMARMAIIEPAIIANSPSLKPKIEYAGTFCELVRVDVVVERVSRVAET